MIQHEAVSAESSSDAEGSSEAAAEIFCPQCAYNLRGLPPGGTGAEARCPECGTAFDRQKLLESQIPWAHRQTIGRVRAYVRTVYRVLRRPGEIGEEVNRPIRAEDARSFRRVTVTLVFLPLAGLLVAGYVALCRSSPAIPWAGGMRVPIGGPLPSLRAAISEGHAFGWVLEIVVVLGTLVRCSWR